MSESDTPPRGQRLRRHECLFSPVPPVSRRTLGAGGNGYKRPSVSDISIDRSGVLQSIRYCHNIPLSRLLFPRLPASQRPGFFFLGLLAQAAPLLADCPDARYAYIYGCHIETNVDRVVRRPPLFSVPMRVSTRACRYGVFDLIHPLHALASRQAGTTGSGHSRCRSSLTLLRKSCTTSLHRSRT